MLQDDVMTKDVAITKALVKASKLVGLQIGIMEYRQGTASAPGSAEYWASQCEVIYAEFCDMVGTLYPKNEKLLNTHLENVDFYAKMGRATGSPSVL